jgi:hypothetical protein
LESIDSLIIPSHWTFKEHGDYPSFLIILIMDISIKILCIIDLLHEAKYTNKDQAGINENHCQNKQNKSIDQMGKGFRKLNNIIANITVTFIFLNQH